jgi:hypothetical protein
MENYDGKWGREIREQIKRERVETLSNCELASLRRIAEQAQGLFPGPWAVTEANFIVYGYLDADPDTGKPIAEVDCYNEHPDIKSAYVAACDPTTILKLLSMATKKL